MIPNSLVESIKQEEGFEGFQYNDHLGNPTIGYGTLLPLSEEDAETLLLYRLQKMRSELLDRKPSITNYKPEAQDILLEMMYQLGVPRLLLFKRMFRALDNDDYVEASLEMRDSKWYTQTRLRADRLATRMYNLS